MDRCRNQFRDHVRLISLRSLRLALLQIWHCSFDELHRTHHVDMNPFLPALVIPMDRKSAGVYGDHVEPSQLRLERILSLFQMRLEIMNNRADFDFAIRRATPAVQIALKTLSSLCK